MVRHWIIRIGDSRHFWISSHLHVWGMKSQYPYFFDYVRKGDILWFMIKASKGTLVAVATYVSHNNRTSSTPSNQDYKWIYHTPEFGGIWNTELHYENLYDLRNKKDICFCTGINSPCPNAVVPYKIQQHSKINLPECYTHITTNYTSK